MLAHSIFAVLSAAVAPVPEAAQFGDWTVACDNARHCESIASIPSAGANNEWVLYVVRGAGANDRPDVEAHPAFDAPTKAARVRIDGRVRAFGFDSNGRLIGDATAFLQALAQARRAEVLAADGTVIGTLAVTGASAALRWTDDQQMRAGTVTAIVAKGARPAGAVPPPPPLPRISQPPVSEAPPQSLGAADVEAIRRIGDCDGDVPPAAVLETYRLDANQTVAIVGCFLGAYQGAFVIVVVGEDGHWAPASIERPEPLPEGIGSSWQYMLTTAGYQDDDRLLSEWAKGRGLADCGRSATWAWDGEMFRLASFRALDECRGASPGTWLSRWQTANDPLEDDE